MSEYLLRNSAKNINYKKFIKDLNCLPNTQDLAKPNRCGIRSESCPVSIRKRIKKMFYL